MKKESIVTAPSEDRTYMFQFYRDTSIRGSGFSLSGTKCVEDTGLITLFEAESLWGKHYSTLLEDLKDGQQSHMAIWQNCETNTDYNSILREIDGSDNLEVKNGNVYKITRTKL